MVRKEIDDPGFDWDLLLRQVVGNQSTIEIFQNNLPLARISPIKPAVAMEDLNRCLADVPSLMEGDAEQFAEDIEAVIRELPPDDDPWTS